MLPGRNCRLGSIGEFLVSGWSGCVGEGAAHLAEELCWGDGLRPGVGVLKQWQQALERVSVGDTTAQRPPEPFDAVGVWIVGGRVHQHELATQLTEQLARQV